jgi:predicted nucleic acid-binding protein
MHILLDTNIILDVLLKREPWLDDSAAIWQASDDGAVKVWITASVLTDVFYVVRRHADLATARRAMQICLDAFQIAGIDRGTLEHANVLKGTDFEDNVLIACADRAGVGAIVTRDPTGLKQSKVKVLSPQQCLALLSGGS